jgi:hypothetical protein
MNLSAWQTQQREQRVFGAERNRIIEMAAIEV